MEIVYQIDAHGDKRKGVLKFCLHCQKQFFTRIDQEKKFCSHKCSSDHRSSNLKVDCHNCGQTFSIRPSKVEKSKKGVHFCTKKCQKEHYESSENCQYRKLFGKEELKCERCGYCEFACGVDIHHIDENRKNNSRENLIRLCSPCHRGLHRRLWKIEELSRV